MNKDRINPDHYKQYPIEVIDMMVSIWGRKKVKAYCLLNAFKYRMRAGFKDNLEEDLEKEKWYLNKARELSKKKPKSKIPKKVRKRYKEVVESNNLSSNSPLLKEMVDIENTYPSIR